MVAGGNDYGVNFWISNKLLLVGGALRKSEMVPGMLSVRSAGRTNCDESGIRRGFQSRDERAAGEDTGAEQSNGNIRCSRTGCNQAPSSVLGLASFI